MRKDYQLNVCTGNVNLNKKPRPIKAGFNIFKSYLDISGIIHDCKEIAAIVSLGTKKQGQGDPRISASN